MKSSDIIILSGSFSHPAVTQSAFDLRDEILLDVGTITKVTTIDEANSAAEAIKSLKDFTRKIESSRKDVKDPVVQLGKAIDKVAKDLTEDLDTEAKRISRILGDYQAEQDRIRRKAEREAAEEERRIREEADAKAQKAIDSGRSVDSKLEKIEAKTFEQTAAVRAVAQQAAPAKIAGLATRKVIKFEVDDIQALAASRPELVKMEANTSAITAILRSNPNLILPGIRHWTENTTVVR